jgi:hypothetical protein
MNDFEHLNLAEVNPDIPTLPDGEYTFAVIEAERIPFAYKTDNLERGITAGQTASRIKLVTSVIQDAENSGRRVYTSLFPDDKTARYLRLIQDATGVIQGAGQTIDEWLKDLVQKRATFTVPVFSKTRKDGRVEATLKFGAVRPA